MADNPQPMILLVGEPIARMSPVKMADLGRIAQRMLDETGKCSAHLLYQKARTRIPGSRMAYAYAFGELARKGRLTGAHFRKTITKR